jgi:hypothetical protein|tara:strand:- start:783 stop:1106 length:324 start_codon:yes stop_codon:yes gene_type:complete
MEDHSKMTQGRYGGLALELMLDFVVMYLVMYTMIATISHFRFNLNNVYMTLMMVAPMTVIMLVSMRSMFPSPRVNMEIGAGAIVILRSASPGCGCKPALGIRNSSAQ